MFTPEILYTVFVLIHQDDSKIFKGGHHYENVTGNQEFSGVPRTQFKKNTIQNYRYFLAVFQKQFGRRDVTESTRNRLMLELMARGGMRIGEVLKLKPQDVQDRKLHLPNPKSGRASEVVFIPQKVADRLREYIAAENILDDKRIFPLRYTRTGKLLKTPTRQSELMK